MIVYIESNFVLELALVQEQHESCEDLLSICEAGHARLVLPAFCIAEPYEVLGRRDHHRRELEDELEAELKLLSRSKTYKDEIGPLRSVTGLLVRSGEEERQRLHETFGRILGVAELIPLIPEVLTEAQARANLRPQDSIVYASILHHLRMCAAAERCFLSKDRHHFDDPDIQDMLSRHGCKMLFGFEDGRRYVRHVLRQTSAGA